MAKHDAQGTNAPSLRARAVVDTKACRVSKEGLATGAAFRRLSHRAGKMQITHLQRVLERVRRKALVVVDER